MYKIIELEKENVDNLNFLFNVGLIKTLFKKEMWIAGGFARVVGNHILCNKNKNFSLKDKLVKYLTNSYTSKAGDIDFFTSKDSFENCKKESFKNRFYSSAFAKNTRINVLEGKNDIHNSFITTGEEFNLQVVDKFMFNSFEECLDSFDLINSKYLLFKDKNKYKLIYHSLAPILDANSTIEISHCNSPFLFKRINKHISYRGLSKISEDNKSKDFIREFLFKAITNYWEGKFYFYSDLFLENSVKALNNKNSFSNEDLAIMIGQYDHITYEKVKQNYGFYFTARKPEDWATLLINNNSEVRSQR
jgi:hypothetical protein